ncbi:MAG: DNA polymerase/3'-5' exonuclease PolX [Clostridia bacterium]|nr:DNA polymerase/3'-5' exonuclease PolX [Clostridia bacterium]
MRNEEVSRIFRSIADMLEIKGESRFRINAYRRAAEAIDALPDHLDDRLRENSLLAIPGIGKDLAAKIAELLTTGKLAYFQSLQSEIPLSLIQLMSIPGIGPGTARVLQEYQVTDVDELERLARAQELRRLPRIKKKTEENILRGIELFRGGLVRRPLGRVLPLAVGIVETLREQGCLTRVSLAGSIRRFRDTVKDIDILGVSSEPARTVEVFKSLPGVTEILSSGPTRISVRLDSGLQVDLRLVDEGEFGAALCYFTGSKEHNVRLRELAIKQGMKLNEYGLFREDERLAGRSEQDVYRLLGLSYIPPELRENRGEIEAALNGKLPTLVTSKDIRGDLHVHSVFSDGHNDLEQIARRALELGLEWVGICDHSVSLQIAGGLSVERLREKLQAVREFNDRSPDIKLLCGAEVDIDRVGNLDYPDEVLSELDVVVAAVHTSFRLDETQMTSRIVQALENPFVHIFAHPTGRLLGEREPYQADLPLIIAAAARNGKALEVNGSFKRLDLSDVHCRAAMEAGVKLSIGSDAHRLEQMDDLFLGVTVARRGWLKASDVLNTMSYRELTHYLKDSSMQPDRTH